MPRPMPLKDIDCFSPAYQRAIRRPKVSWTINAYTLLVAVVQSASTDVGVNKATGPLFKVTDTPQKCCPR